MKTKVRKINTALLLGAIALLIIALDYSTAQTEAPAAKHPRTATTATLQQVDAKPKVLKEQVRGGFVFPAERRMWTRITGKVKVVNAYTLRF